MIATAANKSMNSGNKIRAVCLMPARALGGIMKATLWLISIDLAGGAAGLGGG